MYTTRNALPLIPVLFSHCTVFGAEAFFERPPTTSPREVPLGPKDGQIRTKRRPEKESNVGVLLTELQRQPRLWQRKGQQW